MRKQLTKAGGRFFNVEVATFLPNPSVIGGAGKVPDLI
jgi:hypothetical protein